MVRTKFPIMLNGEYLSFEESEKIRSTYTPPLTKQEMLEKQSLDANMPDMSHMTPWAP